jgi:hypothetical protein
MEVILPAFDHLSLSFLIDNCSDKSFVTPLLVERLGLTVNNDVSIEVQFGNNTRQTISSSVWLHVQISHGKKHTVLDWVQLFFILDVPTLTSGILGLDCSHLTIPPTTLVEPVTITAQERLDLMQDPRLVVAFNENAKIIETEPCSAPALQLKLKQNALPIQSSNRYFAPGEDLEFQFLMEHMLEKNFIRKLSIEEDLPYHKRFNNRTYGAHIPEKEIKLRNGKRMKIHIRFVLVADELNSRTIPEKDNMLPLPSDIFRRLYGFYCVSVLDCSDYFWSFPLHPDCQYMTAFTINNIRYVCCRTPPGLQQIVGFVQRWITSILSHRAISYVDDAPIASFSKDKAVDDVVQVINIFTQNKLRINRSKTDDKLFRSFAIILGREVHSTHVKIDPKKLQYVRSIQLPHTRSEFEHFLGFISWLRGYGPRVEQLLLPFRASLKSNPSQKSFKSTPDLQQCFDRILDWLVSNHSLALPNINLPFCLRTDACGDCVGGYAFQSYDDGIQILEFFSKSLTIPQQKYPIAIKELMAISYGLHHFRHLFAGSIVHVTTDSEAVTLSFNSKRHDKVLESLTLRILDSHQRLTIGHVSHIHNWLADSLSRASIIAQYNHPTFVMFRIKSSLINPNLNERIKLLQTHHLFGHFGAQSMVKSIHNAGFHWPNLYSEALLIAQQCELCIAYNPVRAVHHSALSVAADRVNQLWEIDLKQIPESDNGYLYCLTVKDRFSLFVWLFALLSKTADEVAEHIFNLICTFGAPVAILSDNGKEFDNKLLTELVDKFGIVLHHCQPYHHETQGSVERSHRDIGLLLNKLCDGDFTHWEQTLPLVQLCLNLQTKAPTNTTPFFLQFGRSFKGLPAIPASNSSESNEESINRLIQHYKSFVTHIIPAYRAHNELYVQQVSDKLNNARRIIPFIPSGTLVAVREPNPTSKFDAKYYGRYMVISMDEFHNYTLTNTENLQETVLIPINRIKVISEAIGRSNIPIPTQLAASPYASVSPQIIDKQISGHPISVSNIISIPNKTPSLTTNTNSSVQTINTQLTQNKQSKPTEIIVTKHNVPVAPINSSQSQITETVVTKHNAPVLIISHSQPTETVVTKHNAPVALNTHNSQSTETIVTKHNAPVAPNPANNYNSQPTETIVTKHNVPVAPNPANNYNSQPTETIVSKHNAPVAPNTHTPIISNSQSIETAVTKHSAPIAPNILSSIITTSPSSLSNPNSSRSLRKRTTPFTHLSSDFVFDWMDNSN